jgi:8-oxo-dGTP diphosphatase
MEDKRGSERDWTRRYRLAAGVYAMRGGQILMLERAAGMMIGFWSVPGGLVDPGENPRETAARELFEEAGITPTGPLWLVTIVPLKGYGMDLLSLRYAAWCDIGEVRLSHEHSGWRWFDPAAYRAMHLSDAVAERWRQSSDDDAFNVLSNRAGLDDFLRWYHHWHNQ